MANIAQRSFAGGELAPGLQARTDVAKYGTALATCRNFIVLPTGGVSNRPGTEFIAEVKDSSTVVRPVRFVFNADQTYVLEFGDRYMRVIRNGASVVVSGVAAWADVTDYTVGDLVVNDGVNYYCILAHTSAAATDEPGTGTSWAGAWYALTGDIYEIPTPYLAADLARLQLEQSADVVTIVHPSYAPRNLSRTGHTRWTLDLITFGPSLSPPADLIATGGGAGTALWWAVTALADDATDESLARYKSIGTNAVPSTGTPTVISWDQVTGAGSYNVYRSSDGVTYGFVGTTGVAPATVSSTSWTSDTASVTGTTAGTHQSVDQARITVVTGGADKSSDGAYTIRGQIGVEVFSGNPASTVGRARAFYSRDGEARVDAGIVGTLTLLAGSGGSLYGVPFQGTINVPDNGYDELVIDVVAEVVTITADDAACALDFTNAPDDAINRLSYGTATFSDLGADPDFTIRPPIARNPFAAVDSYPAVVGYSQQRQLFGNTNARPETGWASRTGSFKNFTTSTPLQDDDAVTFTVAGRQVNAIRHFIDLNKLLVLTAGGVWSIDADVFTPTSVNPKRRSAAGASYLRPLEIGSRLLYVDARGPILRELVNDEVTGVQSADLTIFSGHLFAGYDLVDLDVQLMPQPIVWAVRSDGALLGMTYLPEQQVWGWHRHDTDGAVERLCVIPEATADGRSEDAVYLDVQRTINGAARRYFERMASRRVSDIVDACFLDCSTVYDGRNATATTMTLSGGSAWTHDETLTCTASGSVFTAGDVGNAVHLTAADGTQLRCEITAYTSATVVTVRPHKTVPADLRAAATTDWARAVDQMSGLDHLEGKDVGVLADGLVAASPNNPAYDTVTVTGGVVTLDRPYAVVRVGLPYLSDLETLDIDTPQGASLKASAINVSQVGLSLEASRMPWVGRRAPTDAEVEEHSQLYGLYEMVPRTVEDGYEGPPALITDTEHVGIDGEWNSHGRIFVRQVDPLPLTILAAIPQGDIPRMN